MNWIKQEMIDKGADGVIFYPICQPESSVFRQTICEYTIDEIDSVSAFPKSARNYYKLVDGKKIIL